VLIGEDSELTSELDFSVVATSYAWATVRWVPWESWVHPGWTYEKIIPLVNFLGETLRVGLWQRPFSGDRPNADESGSRDRTF